MTYLDDIGARSKDLEKQRDKLINELKNLEEKHRSGNVGEEEYKEKRHEIERALVEIMDRLAQTRFLMGQG